MKKLEDLQYAFKDEEEYYQNLQYAFYVEYYKYLPSILKNKDKEKGWEKRQYKILNEYILKIARKTETFMKKLEEYDKELSSLDFQSSYPGILIGIGHKHEAKGKGEIGMGFTFDYVTGMPYLPGSSLKGILRSGFQQTGYIHEAIKEVLHKDLSDDEIIDLEQKIFEGENGKERFVFYDAVISGKKEDGSLLALDAIAPHSKDGLKEPIPITFLRICPGVKIHFVFRLYDVCLSAGKCIQKNQIKKIFKNILEDFGIGAKTNVGYGVLERIEK